MVKPAASRGLFVVFEGTDRAGKSSQIRLLHDHLASLSLDVEVLAFPDRSTPTGKVIDEYLRGSEQRDIRHLHRLFSENRQEKAEYIRAQLAAGVHIVCDRYAFSGVAYTTAVDKSSSSPADTLQWCIDHYDGGLPRPDLVIYLDTARVSDEMLQLRGGFGDERYERVDIMRAVQAGFDRLSSAIGVRQLEVGSATTPLPAVEEPAPDAGCQGLPWYCIDAFAGDQVKVAALVRGCIDPWIARTQSAPGLAQLGTLW
ncbi:hypothetical protein, variant [Fonticula alba]|uniref:dTMP kinase n=1 Tax=Fonticula alba TaxID=691883 RepID=A0A058Z7A6_FONAL|nr:hypothetical protein, variant [Fonticula alba]KCV70184.1 hypothetical protein, variant [Fonticula alba]|eukprot:XP_009495790.1 hypothetical protein, variant [Fonticula alba]